MSSKAMKTQVICTCDVQVFCAYKNNKNLWSSIFFSNPTDIWCIISIEIWESGSKPWLISTSTSLTWCAQLTCISHNDMFRWLVDLKSCLGWYWPEGEYWQLHFHLKSISPKSQKNIDVFFGVKLIIIISNPHLYPFLYFIFRVYDSTADTIRLHWLLCFVLNFISITVNIMRSQWTSIFLLPTNHRKCKFLNFQRQ